MKIAVGIDRCHGVSMDNACKQTVITALRNAGHTVEDAGRGPSSVQHYAQGHTIDMMIQIACGMCIGTLCDFSYGMKRGYYHSKKGCIIYWTHGWTKYDPETWKSGTAWDDTFSRNLPADYKKSFWGKTLREVYNSHDDIGPFVYGKTGDELAKKLVQGMNGGSTGGNTGGNAGGGTAVDYIKQVISDLDPMGVELLLDGETVKVRRATTNGALDLPETDIELNSISYEDYNPTTPNTLTSGGSTLVDQRLKERFGAIQGTVETSSGVATKLWLQDQMQINQRGYGHTLDCKVIYREGILLGNWVKVNIPSLQVKDKYYYISKLSYEGGATVSLTLDVAPPSRYYEVKEVASTGSGSGGSGKIANANGTDCVSGSRTLNMSIWWHGTATSQTPTANALKVIGNSSHNYAEVARQAGGNPATALKKLHTRYKWQDYADNPYGCTKGPERLYATFKSGGTIYCNCADAAWLMKCVFDVMGLQNYILHGSPCRDGHYWNCVKYNGKWIMGDLCYWKKSHNQLSRM